MTLVDAQPTATFTFPDVAVAGFGARIISVGQDPESAAWSPADLTLGVAWQITLDLPGPGEYILRWTAPGVPPYSLDVSIPLIVAVGAAESLVPTVGEIALLLLSHTLTDEGTGTRTFTQDTSPTAQEAELAAAAAAAELDDLIGLPEIAARYRDEVRRIAAVRAAAQLLRSLDDASTEQDAALRAYDAQWFQRSAALVDRLRPKLLSLS